MRNSRATVVVVVVRRDAFLAPAKQVFLIFARERGAHHFRNAFDAVAPIRDDVICITTRR